MSEQTKAQPVAQESFRSGGKAEAAGNQAKPAARSDAGGAKSQKLTDKIEAAKAQKPLAGSAPEDASPSPPGEERLPERRATQPARAHIAANDDLPSIGGLIYALQQRPSRSPFVFAFGASLVWLLLGTGAGWAMLNASPTGASSLGEFLQHPAALTIAATVLAPIALFWFLALLIWRAQELRLMASAMTEVAVRLAEPDKMAEQSVASLGQTIRRQVAAMNDAISRAIGRAGELEALVHNEVAALEHSYSENELRIRHLIDELQSEREALANNSERVSQTLRGVGAQVAKDIAIAGEQATKTLASSTATLADSLTAKSTKITSAMTAAGAAIDNKIAERGVQLAEAINQTSRKAAEAVDVKANSLFHSLSSVSDKLAKDMPGVLERLDGEQKRLNAIIAAANQNFTALETAVAQRTAQFDSTLQQHGDQMKATLSASTAQMESALQQRGEELKSALSSRTSQLASAIQKQTEEVNTKLSQRAAELNASLSEKTEKLDKTLSTRAAEIRATVAERINALDATADQVKAMLAERIKALDTTVSQHAKSMEQSFTRNTMALSQVLAEGTDAVRQSSAQMAADSGNATHDLTEQAHVLREVSKGLLDQVHSLTQRFEKQGQAIMTAAQALDSSNAKIDSILERRHAEISSLLETVSSKAQGLDKMMRSYTGIIESSLTQVEARARDLSASLAQSSSEQSRGTIQEIERLRAETRAQTEKAMQELQAGFQAIAHQVSDQLHTLTSQFGKTTREMRSTATQTAGQIEATRVELQRRMRDLPQETRQNTEAMRKAVSDQLRALGSLSAIAAEHRRTDSIVPSAPAPSALPPRQSLDTPRPGIAGNGAAPPTRLPLPGGALRPTSEYEPQDAPRRQVPPPPAAYEGTPREDLMSVTSTLAHQLGGVGQSQQRHGGSGVRITGGPPRPSPRDSWSVGDLLARASEPESESYATRQPQISRPPDNGAYAPAPRAPQPPAPSRNGNGDLRLTDLARAIDRQTAADIWHRFQGGERGILSRQLYTLEGQAAFDEISARYRHDGEFRVMVDRYIGDFERLLSEAENKGQDPAVVQNYLTSETGRVYLMLAHASGRLH